jgi:hypothetical protein
LRLHAGSQYFSVIRAAPYRSFVAWTPICRQAIEEAQKGAGDFFPHHPMPDSIDLPYSTGALTMILGKRDLLGNYMDRRDNRLLPAIANDVSMGNPICREKNVTIRLPFFDRIKTILRSRISDRDFALSRNRTYVIELPPAPMQPQKRQNRLNGDTPAKPAKSLGTSPSAFNGARLLFAKKTAEDRKQTPSNLG